MVSIYLLVYFRTIVFVYIIKQLK